jgi:two-component system, cell cycle response regulator
MESSDSDLNQTRLLSTFTIKAGDDRGHIVRIHPVTVGDGIVSLPLSPVVIGRESDCDFVLDSDDDVSRRHAKIEVIGKEYRISDLDSTNGTLLNNEKVTSAALKSGDVIRVGKTILKFLRGNDVETQYHETVYTMMISDGLTGIPNKRFLLDAVQRELARTQRHKRPLSLCVLDIDHFKSINDKYGHLAGDAVLRELCTRVKQVVRKDEVFARFGGEEFVVLLPESTLEQARQFSERIRAIAASDPFIVEGATIQVTVSIGVAHTAGDDELSADELIARADAKLYDAKRNGRNRVVS